MDIKNLLHISATQARTQLGSLLDAVNSGAGPFVIERYGEPIAVLMGSAEYETYEVRSRLVRLRDELNQRENAVREQAAS